MTATHQTPASDASVIREAATPVAATTTERLLERARALGPMLREHGETAETERRLPRVVLDALRDAGFQRLFAPRSLGGLEVDPVTCARVVEEVARFDSAAAWALQSGNVNTWFSARLPDAAVDELYGSNASTIVAAAFHPPQKAVAVPGGFRLTGRAPLASMIHDAEWILFGAIIHDGDQPRMTDHGPALIAVILPVTDVQIIDTWHTLGMRGTDSNDVVFTDAVVPEHRSFPFAPHFTPGRQFQGPLYRYPVMPIVGLFSAAVLLATARNAIEAFRELAQKKTPFGSMKTIRERGTAQASLADAQAELLSGRAWFYDTLGEAWERTVAGEPNTLEQKADLLLAGIHAVRSAVHVTELIHRLAGTTGIYTKSPFERYLRDAHTLRQHGFISENKLEAVGQVYLGLEPDFPLIVF